MFFSTSTPSASVHSSILWIVALTGPNSTTCGQILPMKRPSDVPPVVESVVATPVFASIAAASRS